RHLALLCPRDGRGVPPAYVGASANRRPRLAAPDRARAERDEKKNRPFGCLRTALPGGPKEGRRQTERLCIPGSHGGDDVRGASAQRLRFLDEEDRNAVANLVAHAAPVAYQRLLGFAMLEGPLAPGAGENRENPGVERHRSGTCPRGYPRRRSAS